MSRFNRIVCVVLVCTLAGFAYAKAVKSKELIAAGLGTDLNPDADGMIVMNYHDSSTPTIEVQVKATGLVPQKTYGVQVDPGFTDPLAFTASASGNGSYHNTITNFPEAFIPLMVVRVFEWDGVPSNIDEVAYHELRAYGCAAETCNVVTCSTDADCDLGFPCLRDTCEGGLCFHERRDIDCDDGDPCTADFCTGVDESGNTTCRHDQLPVCP